jgi:hypothetical protein
MSEQDSREIPSTIDFSRIEFTPSRLPHDYKYNHTYMPPLAMVQSLPKTEKPSLAWMLRVVWQSLRIAKNRVTWALNTGRAVRPGDEVLTFSGDPHHRLAEHGFR